MSNPIRPASAAPVADMALVPREPTEAMIAAGSKAAQSAGAFSVPWSQEARAVWSAMIAATQQATEEGVAFAASDMACYEYPGVDDLPLRAAFVSGAVFATQQAVSPPEGVGVVWRDIASEPRVHEIGHLWLAADAAGRVFPGVFVGHRIPADATKVMRVPAPDAIGEEK